MYLNTDKEFIKHYKNEPPCRAYLFYGSDGYSRQVYEKRLIAALTKGNDDMMQRFDGERLSVDSVFDALEAVSMFGGLKIVYVEAFCPDKLNGNELDKFHEMIADLPEQSVLVLSISQQDFSPKSPAKVKKIVEAIAKAGAVICFSTKTRADTAKILRDWAGKAGRELTLDNAYLLIDTCSDDLVKLKTEMEKLCAYAEKEITKEDIALVAAPTVDANIFSLSKLLLRGEYKAALTILDDLFYLREPAAVILATLGFAFCDLFVARLIKQSGKTIAQAAADFGYKGKEFRLENAMRDSAKYSQSFISSSLDAIVEADYQLKSGRAQDKVVLEQLITTIFYLRQKEGRL